MAKWEVIETWREAVPYVGNGHSIANFYGDDSEPEFRGLIGSRESGENRARDYYNNKRLNQSAYCEPWKGWPQTIAGVFELPSSIHLYRDGERLGSRVGRVPEVRQ
jgi:hypothetical protein